MAALHEPARWEPWWGSLSPLNGTMPEEFIRKSSDKLTTNSISG